MDRQPVDSRLIRSVGYDQASSILEVELLESGRIYRYFDVPYSVFDDLMTAESKGAYFNEHVRDMYAYEELGFRLIGLAVPWEFGAIGDNRGEACAHMLHLAPEPAAI